METSSSRVVLASRLSEPSGFRVIEAALKLGIARRQMSDLVNCYSERPPEIAIRLDKAFNGGLMQGIDSSLSGLIQVKKEAHHIKVE